MAEEQQPQQKEAAVDKQVDEDYAVWRKNTPFLYDLVISHALEWPSLTVHWAPLPVPLSHASDPSLAVHRLVLGTHTAEGSPNFLMVADALLPREASETSVDGNAANPIVPKVSFWYFHSLFRELFCGCLVF
jgi:histone-binding protein RBBP4